MSRYDHFVDAGAASISQCPWTSDQSTQGVIWKPAILSIPLAGAFSLPPAHPQLPRCSFRRISLRGGAEIEPGGAAEWTPSLKLDKNDIAVVIIYPQNDVLSEKGLAWPLLHESLKEINTVENIERIFKAAKMHGFEVFISHSFFSPKTKVGSSTDPSKRTRQTLACPAARAD